MCICIDTYRLNSLYIHDFVVKPSLFPHLNQVTVSKLKRLKGRCFQCASGEQVFPRIQSVQHGPIHPETVADLERRCQGLDSIVVEWCLQPCGPRLSHEHGFPGGGTPEWEPQGCTSDKVPTLGTAKYPTAECSTLANGTKKAWMSQTTSQLAAVFREDSHNIPHTMV